jgi:hypothetical protein
MVYLMNTGRPSLPNIHYYRTIQEGYHDVGMDEGYLIGAIEDTERRIKEN